MTTVYISIGNSDDRLSQAEWSAFHVATHQEIHRYAQVTHGVWVSGSTAAWQNACWCIEISERAEMHLRDSLRRIASGYRQDSIAWATAETVFIRPRAVAEPGGS